MLMTARATAPIRLLLTFSFLFLLLPVCRRGSGDLISQFGASLASFRHHERTALDLIKNALGLLAIPLCDFLQLIGDGERLTHHCLALLDAFDQLSTHRLDLLRRGFIFADDGFCRQLADFRGSIAVLDVFRYRRRRLDHWGIEITSTVFIERRPASHLGLNLTLYIGQELVGC